VFDELTAGGAFGPGTRRHQRVLLCQARRETPRAESSEFTRSSAAGFLARTVHKRFAPMTELPMSSITRLVATSSLAFALCDCGGGAISLPPSTTGKTPWLVLLCKYNDVPDEPQAPVFFQQLFTSVGKGTDNLYDYFAAQSHSRLSLDGTVVASKWYTMGRPLSDVTTTYPGADDTSIRYARIRACLDAAQNDFHYPDFVGIAAMFNAQGEAGNVGLNQNELSYNGVDQQYGLIGQDPGSWNVTFLSHEMLHGYGLQHSFDTANNQCGGGLGEYCDRLDIMSAMNVDSFNGIYFGMVGFDDAGPSLNAVYAHTLGWVADAEIESWNGSIEQTFTISALDLANTQKINPVLVEAPVGGAFYSIEYHRAIAWDRAIPNDVVLVGRNGSDNLYRFVDDSMMSGALAAGQTMATTADNIKITVVAIDSVGGTAQVKVSKAK
jgi:M6 family metalloprotease-like protein